MHHSKRKGFTLIEVVVVLAILAILAAILTPNISAYVGKTRKSVDQTNLHTLNTVTAAFRAQAPDPDPFTDPANQTAQLIQVLVEYQFLHEVLEPLTPDTAFEWDSGRNQWLIKALSQAEEPTGVAAFRSALRDNPILYDAYLAKGTAWDPQRNGWTEYYPDSWNGYLEKLLERGDVADNTRYRVYEGTNTLLYENPVSHRQTIVDFNNWDTFRQNYPDKIPPAVLITNQSQFSPGASGSYIGDNLETLTGTLVIYKDSASSTPNSEAVVYMIQPDGSISEPVPLIDVLP